MSKKLLENLKKCPINLNDELGLKYVCVDSEKIRKRIIASENINVNTVPAFVIAHADGKTEIFEGDRSFHWIQTIVQTKLNERSRNQENQRAKQEADQRAQRQEADQHAQRQEADQHAQRQEADQRAQRQEADQRAHERKQQYRAQTQQQANHQGPTNQAYNEETPIGDILGTEEPSNNSNSNNAMSLSSIAKSMQQDRDILDNKHTRTTYQRQYPHAKNQ